MANEPFQLSTKLKIKFYSQEMEVVSLKIQVIKLKVVLMANNSQLLKIIVLLTTQKLLQQLQKLLDMKFYHNQLINFIFSFSGKKQIKKI